MEDNVEEREKTENNDEWQCPAFQAFKPIQSPS